MLSLLLFAAVAASAQNFSASGALSTADGIVSGLRDIAFHLVAGILALIAVVLLAWTPSARTPCWRSERA